MAGTYTPRLAGERLAPVGRCVVGEDERNSFLCFEKNVIFSTSLYSTGIHSFNEFEFVAFHTYTPGGGGGGGGVGGGRCKGGESSQQYIVLLHLPTLRAHHNNPTQHTHVFSSTLISYHINTRVYRLSSRRTTLWVVLLYCINFPPPNTFPSHHISTPSHTHTHTSEHTLLSLSLA